jgi:hypothetical protein
LVARGVDALRRVGLELVLTPRSDAFDVVSKRQDLEDALAEALGTIAEVSAGGGGLGVTTIDIDVHDEGSAAAVLEVLRQVVRQHGRPPGGKVICRTPSRQEWTI